MHHFCGPPSDVEVNAPRCHHYVCVCCTSDEAVQNRESMVECQVDTCEDPPACEAAGDDDFAIFNGSRWTQDGAIARSAPVGSSTRDLGGAAALAMISIAPRFVNIRDAVVSEFDVAIEQRPGMPLQPLGVDFEIHEDHLLVLRVREEGLIRHWNDSNKKQVKPGSALLSVNGRDINNFDQIQTEIDTSKTLTIRVRHVEEFTLELVKTGALGVVIDLDTRHIKEVRSDSPIEKYNRVCLPGYHICAGDKLVAVNGRSHADGKALMQEAKDAYGNTNISVRRGHNAPVDAF